MNNRENSLCFGFWLTDVVTEKENKEQVRGFEVLGQMSSVLNVLSLTTGDASRWRWPADN